MKYIFERWRIVERLITFSWREKEKENGRFKGKVRGYSLYRLSIADPIGN